MRITTLASSSSGNCALLSHGGTHILIDAGISLKRIRAALNRLGLSPGDISAVLVTHLHGDHISGLPRLAGNTNARIYATRETIDSVAVNMPAGTELEIIAPGMEFYVRDTAVQAFGTSHDAAGSVGFVVASETRKFALVTDLGIVTQEVLSAVRGADAAVIEANHDPVMLRDGIYPAAVKQRIASDRGHLSNAACGELARQLTESGARTLILAHLSPGNNTPELAIGEVGAALSRAGAVVGGDVRLSAAPLHEVGDTYEI